MFTKMKFLFFTRFAHAYRTNHNEPRVGFVNSYRKMDAHSCCDTIEEFKKRMETEFNLENFYFFETPQEFGKWLCENENLKF